jgi:hypothetical protein
MQTFLNGEELVNYDKFIDLLKEIDKELASQEDYAGYPDSPKRYFDSHKFFINATEDEKEMIFIVLWSHFITALQHWKADMDKLYTENGRKVHQEFLEQYEVILPYLGKQKSFYIGM